MRKASFIIALSLITVFLTGHYFIYRGVQKAHKKEFKAYIRSNFAKIEQLEISPSELYANNNKITWMDENKEVLLNGVMYDIISIKNRGIKVALYVVNDEDEKELMKHYVEQFNENYRNGNANQKNNNLIKDFLSLKFFQKSYSHINLVNTTHQYNSLFKFKISLVYLGVQTPPPLV